VRAAPPSRTALRVALRRAAHQLYDDKPLVFEDPFAVRILGPHAAEVERTPGRVANRRPRPHSIAMRAFVVARSRYAEDMLARAVAGGVKQYVVLGAGLDTFAHRNPYPELGVLEIDHPATQQWKRELLHEADLPEPQRLTYVPVNFEHQTLAAELLRAGFDPDATTFFSWLGVVPYITLGAFGATVGFIAGQPAGSGVVMDYEQPRAVLPQREQLERDSRSHRVELAGENFKLFFTAGEIATELTGFGEREDLGTAELNARYFSARTDRLRLIGEAPRIVSGWL
jgi:methyltransferase (TIGR00027 family)